MSTDSISDAILEEMLERLNAITFAVQQATTLEQGLAIGVREVCSLLRADRALVYQFLPGEDGVVLSEAIEPGVTPIQGQLIYDPCFQDTWAALYRQGRVRSVPDVLASDLAPCHVEFLTRLQVRANLVVPILISPMPSLRSADVTGTLWGLLIVHQCQESRNWQPLEIQWLKQVALQLGFVVQQAMLQAQLQKGQGGGPLSDNEQGWGDEACAGCDLLDRYATWEKLSAQVPGVIYQYRLYPDGHSYFPYVSKAIQQIYEVAPEQVQYNTDLMLQRLHPEDAATVMSSIETSYETLQLWHQEYRVVLPNRGVRWLEGHAMPERLPDSSVLWHGYIWDITERKQTETRLNQQTEYERMVYKIAQNIRQSLDLDAILNTTVTEVRHILQVDRAIIYRFNPDWSGQVITESVALGCRSIHHWQITDSYFVETQGHTYQSDRITAVPDIYGAGWADCHIELMEQLQVRAVLVVPILQQKQPWGLLVAHQCHAPREWQPLERELLSQLATQVAIAIRQSELYQQVQVLNTSLELQVQERTAQLQQSLEFEALLKRITDKVRDSLDEQQILQTVVQELASGLEIEACDTGIYDSTQTTSTIAYEVTNTLSAAQGCTVTLTEAPHSDVYPFLFRGEICQFSSIVPNALWPDQQLLTMLACPIVDDQGVLGDLWLFKPTGFVFSDSEVRLVKQVANQCAIALRQSRLYQAAQTQVKELERLYELKNDFLSTISHELRTPIASIKMTLQLLDLSLRPLQRLEGNENTIDRYLQILKAECQREIDLINNLLEFTQIDAEADLLQVASIDLSLWLFYVVEPFLEVAQRQHQILQVLVPVEVPSLMTDSTYLSRLLTELLQNACKYTPPGETITVTVKVPEIRASSNELVPEAMQIIVSNSGVTIPAPEHDRIFEKFYRIPNNDPWKYGGTGLGLALVKKLVQQMGGRITVESRDNLTQFTLHLPLALPTL